MSALFVAVTVVCALGASSILATNRDGLGLANFASAIDNLFASLSLSRTFDPGDWSDRTGSIGPVQRDAKPLRVSTQVLAAVVRDNARTTGDEFARVNDEIATLKDEVSSVKGALASVRTGMAVLSGRTADIASTAMLDPLEKHMKDLATGLTAANGEIAGLKSTTHILYSSIDQMTASHIRDIEAINGRIGKIEDVISLRADATSAIPTRSIAPLPRKRAPRRPVWTAEETSPGTYLVKGPSGIYEVTEGGFVPGLGRVATVRGHDGRLRLVTTGKELPTTHP
jgi:hypothetical protein